jgi:hypothetical protein
MRYPEGSAIKAAARAGSTVLSQKSLPRGVYDTVGAPGRGPETNVLGMIEMGRSGLLCVE